MGAVHFIPDIIHPWQDIHTSVCVCKDKGSEKLGLAHVVCSDLRRTVRALNKTRQPKSSSKNLMGSRCRICRAKDGAPLLVA